MENHKKQMWQYPWRYKESIAIVAGIIIIGYVLQITIGRFNFFLLQFPVNLILAGSIIFFSIISAFYAGRNFFKWLSGVPFCVTLITALLILGLIMGLTPQTTGDSEYQENIFTILGFDRMTSSWPFILIYLIVLISLGTLITRRLKFFSIKDYAFYLNHIGLWIVLMAAGLGAADMKRYVMTVREEGVEWRVLDCNNEILELPIAIELNDFYMEEYPPKLTIIDRETGKAQPENKAEFFHIDSKRPQGKLLNWNISLEEYIHDAIRNSDSTYREIHMPGASPAAKITVENIKTGEELKGWVSAGNISQLYMVLNLDTMYSVLMTQPEPKRFVSDINIFTEDGKKAHTLLEVNKPYKLGNWMLYQYGYDEMAGKLSTYTEIELVYDPWIIPVYIGIFLFAAGSLCMLWSGNRRKEEEL